MRCTRGVVSLVSHACRLNMEELVLEFAEGVVGTVVTVNYLKIGKKASRTW